MYKVSYQQEKGRTMKMVCFCLLFEFLEGLDKART